MRQDLCIFPLKEFSWVNQECEIILVCLMTQFCWSLHILFEHLIHPVFFWWTWCLIPLWKHSHCPWFWLCQVCTSLIWTICCWPNGQLLQLISCCHWVLSAPVFGNLDLNKELRSRHLEYLDFLYKDLITYVDIGCIWELNFAESFHPFSPQFFIRFRWI